MFQPIHHTFGPHANVFYSLKAISLILRPWLWKNGKASDKLNKNLSSLLDGECSLFSSGREAIYAILCSLNLKDGDEIIIQGYTCSVVPNAIRAAGGRPIFADIDSNSLNLTVSSVQKKITKNTKAIICQHTFGIPADAKSIKLLCDEKNIILIEDCAHRIPDENDKSDIGKYGDTSFFSFGRDKAISGITGGATISKNQSLAEKIRKEEVNSIHLPSWTIFRLLHYPIIYLVCKPFYGIKIGKILLWIAGKTRMLVPYVTAEERNGKMAPRLYKLPNACATLTQFNLNNLKKINNHRKKLTKFYLSEIKGFPIPSNIDNTMSLLKFPLFTDKANEIRNSLKKHNIYLEDGWTSAVICPKTVNNEALGYKRGLCPEAEKVAKNILTLPTHPEMTMEQAKKLIKIIHNYILN